MLFEKTFSSQKRIDVPALLKKREAQESAFLAENIRILNRRGEVWWFMAANGDCFFMANLCTPPYRLYLFRVELGDLLTAADIVHAVETGELKAPIWKPFTP